MMETSWAPALWAAAHPMYVGARGGGMGGGHWKGKPPPAFSKSKGCPPKRFPLVTPPDTSRGASLLSCGDVEANPGPPPTGW